MASILFQPQCFKMTIITSRDFIYSCRFTLILAWIGNHIHYKMWNEITYLFLNVSVAIAVWEWLFKLTWHFTWHVINLLGAELNHVNERAPVVSYVFPSHKYIYIYANRDISVL